MLEKDSNGRTYWHRDIPLLRVSTHPHGSCIQTLDPRPLRPQTWQNLQRRQHQVS